MTAWISVYIQRQVVAQLHLVLHLACEHRTDMTLLSFTLQYGHAQQKPFLLAILYRAGQAQAGAFDLCCMH